MGRWCWAIISVSPLKSLSQCEQICIRNNFFFVFLRSLVSSSSFVEYIVLRLKSLRMRSCGSRSHLISCLLCASSATRDREIRTDRLISKFYFSPKNLHDENTKLTCSTQSERPTDGRHRSPWIFTLFCVCVRVWRRVDPKPISNIILSSSNGDQDVLNKFLIEFPSISQFNFR